MSRLHVIGTVPKSAPRGHATNRDLSSYWWYSYCPSCTRLYWSKYHNLQSEDLEFLYATDPKKSHHIIDVSCPICESEYLITKLLNPRFYLMLDDMKHRPRTDKNMRELWSNGILVDKEDDLFWEIRNIYYEYQQNIIHFDDNDIDIASKGVTLWC